MIGGCGEAIENWSDILKIFRMKNLPYNERRCFMMLKRAIKEAVYNALVAVLYMIFVIPLMHGGFWIIDKCCNKKKEATE